MTPQTAKVYLKHRWSERIFVITDKIEIELDMVNLLEKKRSLFAKRTPKRLKDTENYEIISRRKFIALVQKKQIDVSHELRQILNIVQNMRIVFEYTIF
jgi:hypothetical protein